MEIVIVLILAIAIIIAGCMRTVKEASPRAHSVIERQGKKALRASGKGAWKAAKKIFRKVAP